MVSLAAWGARSMAGGCSQVPSLGGSKLVHSWVLGMRDSLWARPPATGNQGGFFCPTSRAPQPPRLPPSIIFLGSPWPGSFPV